MPLRDPREEVIDATDKQRDASTSRLDSQAGATRKIGRRDREVQAHGGATFVWEVRPSHAADASIARAGRATMRFMATIGLGEFVVLGALFLLFVGVPVAVVAAFLLLRKKPNA